MRNWVRHWERTHGVFQRAKMPQLQLGAVPQEMPWSEPVVNTRHAFAREQSTKTMRAVIEQRFSRGIPIDNCLIHVAVDYWQNRSHYIETDGHTYYGERDLDMMAAWDNGLGRREFQRLKLRPEKFLEWEREGETEDMRRFL